MLRAPRWQRLRYAADIESATLRYAEPLFSHVAGYACRHLEIRRHLFSPRHFISAACFIYRHLSSHCRLRFIASMLDAAIFLIFFFLPPSHAIYAIITPPPTLLHLVHRPPDFTPVCRRLLLFTMLLFIADICLRRYAERAFAERERQSAMRC